MFRMFGRVKIDWIKCTHKRNHYLHFTFLFVAVAAVIIIVIVVVIIIVIVVVILIVIIIMYYNSQATVASMNRS